MNDLEKMSQMAINNQDITLSTTLVSANKVKQGGHITMGVAEKTLMDIVLNQDKYYLALYVINKEQFNDLK